LYRQVQPLILSFPKPWRYSIGEKLCSTLLAIIEGTCQALYARQPLKEPYILKLTGSIQTVQLFIRLALEEKLITEQQYFSLSAKVIEFHKMALGWLNSVRVSP
jgi:hypothetical protein